MGKIPLKLQLDFESNFSSNLFHFCNEMYNDFISNKFSR